MTAHYLVVFFEGRLPTVAPRLTLQEEEADCGVWVAPMELAELLVHLALDVNVINTPCTLYILYIESLMKYTGRCQNDFNVHG